MNAIERLKQLMKDEKLSAHDVSVSMNKHIATVYRWIRTGKINVEYERILNDWLVTRGK